MRNLGPVAVVCVGVLTLAYLADVDPVLIALGVIGLLGYMAFIGGQAYKKKPVEQQRPWYMD